MTSPHRLKWRKKSLLKFPDRIELYQDVWSHWQERGTKGYRLIAKDMNLSEHSVRDIVNEIKSDGEIKALATK